MSYQNYLAELSDLYISIQEKHKKYLRLYPLWCVITFISLGLVFVTIRNGDFFDQWVIVRIINILIFTPIGIYFGLKILKGDDLLNKDFKNQFIIQVIKIVLPNAIYDYQGGFTSDILFSNGSGIFENFGLSNYTSEDYIKGKIKNWDLDLSESLAEEKVGKSTNKIFDGIIIKLKLPVVFTYKLFIQSKNLKHKAKYDNYITLESLEWNRLFDTYCDDPVFARYILNPAVMQRILDLQNSHGNISLSFKDSYIYILWNDNSSFWEIKKQILRKDQINDAIIKIFSDWDAILNLINQLQLEREIWSKMQFLKHIEKSI
jgi:hypothetical protein